MNAYVERYNLTFVDKWLNQYLLTMIAKVKEFATKWLWSCNNEKLNMELSPLVNEYYYKE